MSLQLKELKFYINNIARCLSIVVLLSERRQYHQFNTPKERSTLLSVDYIKITQQASDLLSISEQYIAQHSKSLWSSINSRAIYSPSFNKHIILYQFQSNMQLIVQKVFDIISISDQYKAQHSTSLWLSINFRTIYSPAFKNPMILYQFQSNINPIIQHNSNLLPL